MARIELTTSKRIADRKSQEIIKEAHNAGEQMLAEETRQLETERDLFRKDLEENRREIEELRRKIDQKTSVVFERETSLNRLQTAVGNREQSVRDHERNNSAHEEEFRQKMEEKSGSTQEIIKEQQIQSFVNEERRDTGHVLQRFEDDIRRGAESRAREILMTALQRLPVSGVVQHSAANMEMPTQDMLSRLLAREGRYIRILESFLDVEITLEDTEEPLSLSSPDPIKREVAKVTVDRLFHAGRIHPERIREIVREVTADTERKMQEETGRLLKELNIRKFRPEARKALGRLLFRYSYGQNQLHHSKEAALLAGALASALGCDVEIAKRGALLHDVGKGYSHDDKTHVELGVEMAEQWGEHPMVINAIASHHGDSDQQSQEAAVVQIAESISGARPGARREMIASYLERVEKLENIATEFEGVDTAFAIYAGRELRILVNSEKVDDTRAEELASDIARKIEDGLTYPGRIKITVIRELKTSSYTN